MQSFIWPSYPRGSPLSARRREGSIRRYVGTPLHELHGVHLRVDDLPWGSRNGEVEGGEVSVELFGALVGDFSAPLDAYGLLYGRDVELPITADSLPDCFLGLGRPREDEGQAPTRDWLLDSADGKS